jgi:hypothetical protein
VPPNTTHAEIGSDLARSHLLDGRKLALQKIPFSAFGLQEQRDIDAMRGLNDYTYFGGKHQGAETRVFIPPSLGWKQQMELDEREASYKEGGGGGGGGGGGEGEGGGGSQTLSTTSSVLMTPQRALLASSY